MNVSLTPELERFVLEQVRSGLYQTNSEVIRAALRLLNEASQTHEHLLLQLQPALAQVEQGQTVALNQLDFNAIKTRGRQRGKMP